MTVVCRNRTTIVFVLSAAVAIYLGTPGCSQGSPRADSQPSQKRDVVLSEDVQVEQLAPGVWRHVTYKYLPSFGRSPANGLVVCADGEAALVDTPWNDEQTACLCDWVERELGARVTLVVVTHAHDDCLGGLREAHRRGARSYALDKAAPIARDSGKEVPQTTFTEACELRIGGETLELRYLGGGHTIDNIVVWIPSEKVLFGGCLVRSAGAQSLGYTGEADLAAWPVTIRAVRARCADARLIIPGHGDPGGLDTLDRTLELLRQKGYE